MKDRRSDRVTKRGLIGMSSSRRKEECEFFCVCVCAVAAVVVFKCLTLSNQGTQDQKSAA